MLLLLKMLRDLIGKFLKPSSELLLANINYLHRIGRKHTNQNLNILALSALSSIPRGIHGVFECTLSLVLLSFDCLSSAHP